MTPPLHKEEIKAQLRIRFGTVGEFERQKGLMAKSTSMVLNNRAILRTAEAIAETLDIPVYRVSQLYHDRYTKLATSPRHRPGPRKSHDVVMPERAA